MAILGNTTATTIKTALIDADSASINALSSQNATITGPFRVNNYPIQAYRYGSNGNAAAITMDKAGSHCAGIGGAGNMTIKFASCDSMTSGLWTDSASMNWSFIGNIKASESIQVPKFKISTLDKTASNSLNSTNNIFVPAVVSGQGTVDYILHMSWTGNKWASQIGLDSDATYGDIYIRKSDGDGVWSNWKKVWHEGNLTPSNYIEKAGSTENEYSQVLLGSGNTVKAGDLGQVLTKTAAGPAWGSPISRIVTNVTAGDPVNTGTTLESSGKIENGVLTLTVTVPRGNTGADLKYTDLSAAQKEELKSTTPGPPLDYSWGTGENIFKLGVKKPTEEHYTYSDLRFINGGTFRTSTAWKYENAIEYCTSSSAVSWSNDQVLGGNASWADNIGKNIIFIIACTNGNEIVSIQKIHSKNYLLPSKSYYIVRKGDTGAIGPNKITSSTSTSEDVRNKYLKVADTTDTIDFVDLPKASGTTAGIVKLEEGNGKATTASRSDHYHLYAGLAKDESSGGKAASSAISDSANKAGYLSTDASMELHPERHKADAYQQSLEATAQYSNEINFGGTNNSTTIYIGYRGVGSRPVPSKFVFGSSGTANLKASGVEVNNVYLTDHSYINYDSTEEAIVFNFV